MINYNNAAKAASFESFHSLRRCPERYVVGNPVYFCALQYALRPATPVSPIASRLPGLYIPPFEMAQVAQTRHRQNALVCATLSLIKSILYLGVAQWHRQNHNYCARARTRAVNRLYSLTYYFYFIENCMCHCAYPVIARLCVCSTRMFLSVPCVPKFF